MNASTSSAEESMIDAPDGSRSPIRSTEAASASLRSAPTRSREADARRAVTEENPPEPITRTPNPSATASICGTMPAVSTHTST
jgi:hypothetical protein